MAFTTALLNLGQLNIAHAASNWSTVTIESYSRFGELVQSKSNPDFLYVAPGRSTSSGESIYRSIDGGLSWTSSGPSSVLEGFGVTDMSVDPTDPDNLFAINVASSTEAFFTNNGGSTWSALPTEFSGNPSKAYRVVFDPFEPQRLYRSDRFDGSVWSRVGMGFSNDSGVTWQRVGATTTEVVNLAASSAKSGLFVANISETSEFYGDFSISVDAGHSWTPLLFDGTGGDGTLFMYDVQFSPFDANIAVAGTNGGIARSADGGETWSRIAGTLPEQITAVAFDPWRPSSAYAAGSAGGLFRSDDYGMSWSRLESLPPVYFGVDYQWSDWLIQLAVSRDEIGNAVVFGLPIQTGSLYRYVDTPAPIPLPGALILFGSALAGLSAFPKRGCANTQVGR